MSTLVQTPPVVSWPAAASLLVAPVMDGPLGTRLMLSARTRAYHERWRPERALAGPTPEASGA